MTEPTHTPKDDALSALYASGREQPDAELDARILGAARDEVARPPRRKWRYPVGVGAAASALLAVVLMLQTQQSTDEMRALTKSAKEFAVEMDAQMRTPTSTIAAPPSAAPAEPSPERSQLEEVLASTAERAALEDKATEDSPASWKTEFLMYEHQPEAPVASGRAPLGSEAHRDLELATADAAAAATIEACVATDHVTTDGVALCIDDHEIQVHDAAACTEILSLERTALGTVTLAREDDWIVISIEDARMWRIRCAANAWQVEALR